MPLAQLIVSMIARQHEAVQQMVASKQKEAKLKPENLYEQGTHPKVRRSLPPS